MISMLNDIMITAKKMQCDEIIYIYQKRFGPYVQTGPGKLILEMLEDIRNELDDKIKEEEHLDET